jgi:hypothetical protein
VGKYDSVIRDLPKLPPADGTYQDRVDAFKATIENRDATALGRAYAHLRTGSGRTLGPTETEQLVSDLGKDGLEALLSIVNLRIAAHEQLLVASQSEAAEGWGKFGVKSNALRLSTGDTVRVEHEPYGKVMDKEQFRLWCIANGYERSLQLWPSTMNAMVKERLLKGEEPPDGCEAFGLDKVKFVTAKVED